MLESADMTLDGDGHVTSARIGVNDDQDKKNPLWQALAESALRAALNKACQPLAVPRGHLTIAFSTADLK